MSETLIRRVVTADRGSLRKHRHKVTVSTEQVIECIGAMPDRWTTLDVATAMGISEHAARTAIRWLSDHRRIRQVGIVLRFTHGTNKPYEAKVYETCPEPGLCDVRLLNRVFLLRA